MQAGVSPQELTSPARGWQGSVAASGSEAWSAQQGRPGREQSSRCWPLMQAAKQMQMGYFSLQTCWPHVTDLKRRQNLFLSILGLKLTPLFFPLPRLP